MKKLLLIFLYFASLQTFSQNLQLIDTSDYKEREKLIIFFEDKYDVFNQNIKAEYKGAIRKEIMAFYNNSQTSFLDIIKSKKLLFDSQFQNYVDSLYSQLKIANPLLENENIKLYISKNTTPNAISIGDGTIVLNIGLFCFLENEYQLQSVLAHEIGHQILLHIKKNIIKRANINTNVLSNNSITSRSIKTEKYNKGSKSFNILKSLLYEEGEDRRFQETEADSIGYVLYKNTSSPKNEYINALATLRKYDSVPSITIDSLTYYKIFDLPEQKFKKEWLKNEDFKNYNYEFYKAKIDVDSLKEHPDIQIRIDKLKSSFPELQNENYIVESDDVNFNTLQKIASKAYVENLHYLNEYGLSIYLILKKLEENDTDVYYKKWLAINFEALYDAKKKYQLNRYVDRIIPNEQSESYQTFLNFIWNLSLNEIKNIADYYQKIN